MSPQALSPGLMRRGSRSGDVDAGRRLCGRAMRGTGRAGEASAWLAGSIAASVSGEAVASSAGTKYALRGVCRSAGAGSRRPMPDCGNCGGGDLRSGRGTAGGAGAMAEGDGGRPDNVFGRDVPADEAAAEPLEAVRLGDVNSVAGWDVLRLRALDAVSDRYDLP